MSWVRITTATSLFNLTLVTVMHEQVYAPGEFIVKYGEISSEMYFIRRGKVEVLTSEGHVRIF